MPIGELVPSFHSEALANDVAAASSTVGGRAGTGPWFAIVVDGLAAGPQSFLTRLAGTGPRSNLLHLSSGGAAAGV